MFITVHWDLVDFPDECDGDIRHLVQKVTSLKLNVNMSRSRPASFFPAGWYTIRLTLVNWLDQSASSEVRIYKNTSSQLQVDFILPSTEITSSTPFSLDGQVTGFCQSSQAGTCNYMWLVDSTSFAMGVNSFNSKRLYVPAFSLTGGVHIITLQVTCGSLYSEVSRTLAVSNEPPAPMAYISGGDRAFGLSSGTSYVGLSAELSWNKNYPQYTDAAWQSLDFTWSCTFRPSEDSLGYQLCPTKLYSSNQASLTLFMNKFPNSSLELVFSVQVAVRKSDCVDKSDIFVASSLFDVGNCPVDPFADTAVASALISFTPDKIPVVQLALTASIYDFIGVPSDGNIPAYSVYILPSSSPILLIGSVQNSGGSPLASISWTLLNEPSVTCHSPFDWCSSGNLLSSQCVSMPGVVDEVQSQCSNSSSQTPSTSNLLVCKDLPCAFGLGINPSAFLGARGTYRFQLQAKTMSGLIGSASISFQFKPGPNSGFLDVFPLQGIALSTVFTASALQWQDATSFDAPLLYSFSYTIMGCQEAFCSTIVQSSSLANNAQFLLSRGNFSISATISDMFGSTTVVEQMILVHALNISVPDLYSFTRAYVLNASTIGDVEACVHIISLAARTLNDQADTMQNRRRIDSTLKNGNSPLPHWGLSFLAASSELVYSQDNLQVETVVRAYLIDTLQSLINKLNNAVDAQYAGPEIVLQLATSLTLVLSNVDAIAETSMFSSISAMQVLAGNILNIYKNYQPVPFPTNSDKQPFPPIVSQADSLAKLISQALASIISIFQVLDFSYASTLRRNLHNVGLELEAKHTSSRRKIHLQSSLPLTQINGLLEVISQASALAIANAVPNRLPVIISNLPSLQIYVERVEGQALPGYFIEVSKLSQITNEMSDSCLQARNIEQCCKSRNGANFQDQCCYGAACKNWTVSSWGSSSTQVLLPTNLNYNSLAYEIQVSLIDSSFFNSETSTEGNGSETSGSSLHLLSGSSAVMVEMRQVHSNTPLSPALFLSPTILRIPLATQSQGVGCVTWDETEQKWSITGLIKSQNVSDIKTFCRSVKLSSNTTNSKQVH